MRPSLITPPSINKFDGNRPARTAGILRPGIRRLTANGRKNPKAVAAYKQALAAGATFEQVADAVKRATGEDGLTTPQNTPFFTLFECVDTAVRDLVLRKYGEVVEIEGVPVTVIKRLPIAMYSDTVEGNLDFQFEQYGAGRHMLRWSASATADEAGRLGIAVDDRVCREFVPVPLGNNGKAVRLPNGRDASARGRCEPSTCPEYQAKKCNLRGKLYFHIMGIGLSAPFELPVGSKHFGLEADDTLETIRNATGGNLTRFENPVFFLTKQTRRVGMIGDDGQPKKVEQIITVLEAAADMPKLRLMQAGSTSLGNSAAMLLDGASSAANGPHPAAANAEGIVVARPPVESMKQTQGQSGRNEQTEHAPFAGSVLPVEDGAAGGVASAPVTGRSLQVRVAELSRGAGFKDGARVKAYAEAKFGTDWVRTEASLTALIRTLEAIAEPRARLVKALADSGVEMDAFLADDQEPPYWDFDVREIDARLNAT